jgi:hypothetical protein
MWSGDIPVARKVPWLNGPNMEYLIYINEIIDKLFNDARNIGKADEELKMPKVIHVQKGRDNKMLKKKKNVTSVKMNQSSL